MHITQIVCPMYIVFSARTSHGWSQRARRIATHCDALRRATTIHALCRICANHLYCTALAFPPCRYIPGIYMFLFFLFFCFFLSVLRKHALFSYPSPFVVFSRSVFFFLVLCSFWSWVPCGAEGVQRFASGDDAKSRGDG